MPLCYLNRRSVNARDIGHSDFSSMSIFGINHTVFVGTVPLYIYICINMNLSAWLHTPLLLTTGFEMQRMPPQDKHLVIFCCLTW